MTALQVVRNSEVERPLLTVIVTLRAASQYDIVERINYQTRDTERPSNVQVLVVDEGSPSDEALRIGSLTRKLGFHHLYVPAQGGRFSPAAARNAGAKVARGRFIMHADIDLVPYPGFYRSVLEEISVQGLSSNPERFITVPVIYLSETMTFRMLSGDVSRSAILHELLMGGPAISHVLPASSAIIVSRDHYLAVGGYDERFDGWGLEDLEYAYRLLQHFSFFPRPADYHWLPEGGFSRQTAYRGWRSQFRLHGDLLARKGIYLFHSHHPRNDAWRNAGQWAENRLTYLNCIAEMDKAPLPRPSPTVPDAAPIFDMFRDWMASVAITGTDIVDLSPAQRRGSALAKLGYSHFHAGRFPEAVDAFERARADLPQHSGLDSSLAEALFAVGETSKARAVLRKAYQLRPNDKRTLLRLAVMHFPWLGLLLTKTAHKVPH